MKFQELTIAEYNNFAETHPYGSFHQAINWGKLKAKNGWDYFLLGIKKGDEVIAAALVLKKKLAFGYCLLYSPRGFLLDYEDDLVLITFTDGMRHFGKKQHAIFVKIDPCVINKERNIDGDIVNNGIDNTHIVNKLKMLGYKHNGFNLYMEDLQPRWAFCIDLANKTEEEVLNNMESKTRQLIHKNEKNCVRTREIGVSELELFTKIMEHTATRRGFIDRPYSYYKNMLEILGDNAKILIAELHVLDYLEELKEQIKVANDQIIQKEAEISSGTKAINIEKTSRKILDLKAEVDRLTQKETKGQKMLDEDGPVIILGGIIFMIHSNEILSLFGGAYDKYMDFLSPYTTNWDMIKYAINNGYKRYNFYGITGDFANTKTESYGLYNFKRGFGGVVTEYIGEFDLILSKPLYLGYKLALKAYDKIKTIKR